MDTLSEIVVADYPGEAQQYKDVIHEAVRKYSLWVDYNLSEAYDSKDNENRKSRDEKVASLIISVTTKILVDQQIYKKKALLGILEEIIYESWRKLSEFKMHPDWLRKTVLEAVNVLKLEQCPRIREILLGNANEITKMEIQSRRSELFELCPDAKVFQEKLRLVAACRRIEQQIDACSLSSKEGPTPMDIVLKKIRRVFNFIADVLKEYSMYSTDIRHGGNSLPHYVILSKSAEELLRMSPETILESRLAEIESRKRKCSYCPEVAYMITRGNEFYGAPICKSCTSEQRKQMQKAMNEYNTKNPDNHPSRPGYKPFDNRETTMAEDQSDRNVATVPRYYPLRNPSEEESNQKNRTPFTTGILPQAIKIQEGKFSIFSKPSPLNGSRMECFPNLSRPVRTNLPRSQNLARSPSSKAASLYPSSSQRVDQNSSPRKRVADDSTRRQFPSTTEEIGRFFRQYVQGKYHERISYPPRIDEVPDPSIYTDSTKTRMCFSTTPIEFGPEVPVTRREGSPTPVEKKSKMSNEPEYITLD